VFEVRISIAAEHI